MNGRLEERIIAGHRAGQAPAPVPPDRTLPPRTTPAEPLVAAAISQPAGAGTRDEEVVEAR